MLKLVNLKKLKEDYPEVSTRMVLPEGLDVNRVTLPVILTSNAAQDQKSTATAITLEKTKKNKTGGFLGLYKSSNSSQKEQEPNASKEPDNATSAIIPTPLHLLFQARKNVRLNFFTFSGSKVVKY